MYRIHQRQLSAKGNFKGLYWHIKVLQEACERRGLKAESVVDVMLHKCAEWYLDNGKNGNEQKCGGVEKKFGGLRKLGRVLKLE